MEAVELPTGTITFLFTDIEGSTTLLQRLGRERYGALLARHNSHLRDAFARHGGVEVDRQGDGFFVVFRSAGAAVAAAAEAQRLLAGQEWPEAVSVRVRMGLHTGEAGSTDGVYVGVAIHVAAAVGAAAHGGQILLTGTSTRIVEQELPEGAHVRDLGERRLKGLERPERLYSLELSDLPAPTSTRPPTPAAARDGLLLLEREAELAELRALAGQARHGVGRLVVIEGGAGIGKSSLLAELRRIGRDSGLDVLAARGGELEGDFAFGIVRQLFEPVLATAPAGERAELLSGAAELAAPLFGAGSSTPPDAAGEASFAVLHGLYWLAANFALRRPTLLVVDDLHWADDPSLRWLAYVARRLEGLPLLVVAGTRPIEQGRSPILLTELVADPQAAVIRPGVLGRESLATLGRTQLGSEPEPEFVDALLTASGGNPLYADALLHALAIEGLAPTIANAPRLLALGPEPVVRMVALRLARMPVEAAELARAAAVLGESAELHLADELTGLDAASAGRAATALVRAGVLRRESPLEFIHPVVRTAIYEEIDSGARMTAHRRAAEILLASGARPEQAAAHLLRTLPCGDAFVTETLRRAAERAVAEGAPEAAVSYLRRALAEPPGEALGDVLAELGLAERLVDLPASVNHLTEAVPVVADPVRRAELVLELSNALWLSSRPAEAVEALRAELGRSAHPDVRERVLADLVGLSYWDRDLHRLALRELADVDEERLHGGLGTDSLLAVLAELEARRGSDCARALTLARRALASGRLVRKRAMAFFSAQVALVLAGELDGLDAPLAEALALARRAGDVPTVAEYVLELAWVAVRRGDLIGAERELAEFESLSGAHGLDHAPLWTASLTASAALEQGRLEDAVHTLTRVAPVNPDGPSPGLSYFLEARGRLRLQQRRAGEALGDFLAAGDICERTGSFNPALCAWQSGSALALDALGRRAEALERAKAELERARMWGEARALGISLQALARIAAGDEGLEALREAVEVLADSSARLEHARALAELGAALRSANNRREARKHLREAIDLAHRCGATALVERANDEIAATGAHKRSISLSGLEALTASERRVAQMAAEEMSNKEIAQALFVTVKTVEVHLSSVYRKLEIGSRRELPAALYARHESPSVPARG